DAIIRMPSFRPGNHSGMPGNAERRAALFRRGGGVFQDIFPLDHERGDAGDLAQCREYLALPPDADIGRRDPLPLLCIGGDDPPRIANEKAVAMRSERRDVDLVQNMVGHMLDIELARRARRIEIGEGNAPIGRLARNNVAMHRDRKSTRLNSSHVKHSYAVFCLNKNTYNKETSKA